MTQLTQNEILSAHATGATIVINDGDNTWRKLREATTEELQEMLGLRELETTFMLSKENSGAVPAQSKLIKLLTSGSKIEWSVWFPDEQEEYATWTALDITTPGRVIEDFLGLNFAIYGSTFRFREVESEYGEFLHEDVQEDRFVTHFYKDREKNIFTAIAWDEEDRDNATCIRMTDEFLQYLLEA